MDSASETTELGYLRRGEQRKPVAFRQSDGRPAASVGAGRDGVRTIMVCADDYALSRGIGIAIRRLAEAGRISATSCLVTSPLWREEAVLLRPCLGRIDVGLHLSFTYPPPLGRLPTLAAPSRPPTVGGLLWRSLLGRIDAEEVAFEVDSQIDRFGEATGRLPDFIDSHHHVHILPGIREAVIAVFARRLRGTGAWLRLPPRPLADVPAHWQLAVPGAAAIGLAGRRLARLAAVHGIPGNAGMRGIRRFSNDPPYARLAERFLRGLDHRGLIICHPGIGLGEAIPTRHPMAARQDEYRFLMSAAFPLLLLALGCQLGRFAEC